MYAEIFFVMVNFRHQLNCRCQLDWASGGPDICSNIILDEINT